jgi:hypothetical protein
VAKGKKKQTTLSPYPFTSTAEQQSIVTIQSLVDLKRIKVHGMSVMDKVPNHDGSIWVTNEDQVEQAEIRVQIKTLSAKETSILKYSCKTSFLHYCSHSVLPVLLLAVDNKNKMFYWVHYGIDEARELLNTISGNSFTITLQPEKCINGSDHNYITEWIKIYEHNRLKLVNYEFIRELSTQMENDLEKLELKVKVYAGQAKPEYAEIQRFLDFYNTLLDRDFNLVKETFYPNCWKIGIGIINYSDEELSHFLYPIDYSNNELLIKEIVIPNEDKVGIAGLQDIMKENSALSYVHHLYRNPIKKLPREYAYDVIKKQVFDTIGKVNLPVENEFLASEYVFAFIMEFYTILGLSNMRKEYSIFEVFHGIYIIAPHLFHKLNTTISEDNYENVVINLDQLKKEVERTKTKVQFLPGELFLKHKYKLVSKRINVNLVQFYLEYLRRIGLHDIYRQLSGYSKFVNSLQTTEENANELSVAFSQFFTEVPKIYSSLINRYFPHLSDELSFFKTFDVLVVEIDVYPRDGKVYLHFAELIHSNEYHNKRVIVSDYLDPDSILKKLWGVPGSIIPDGPHTIEINNESFRISKIGRTSLNFASNNTPISTYCLDLLKVKLEKYFEEKLKAYNRDRLGF